MQTLAHFGDGGPGPWILLFPLIWALVIAGGVTLLRRAGRRGPGRRGAPDDSPITVLGHRFASGGDRRGRVLAPAVGAGRAVRPHGQGRCGMTTTTAAPAAAASSAR